MKSFIVKIFVLMSIVNTASCQSADRYSGVFSNEALGLKLNVKKSGNGFEGYFEFQNQRYPFNGQEKNGMLSADYDFDGKKVPFTLKISSGKYYLNSEGYDIEMQQEKKAPADVAGENSGNEINKKTITKQGSGNRMSDPYAGYSFQVPNGWTATEESGAFKLRNTTTEIEIQISQHNFQTKEELIGDAADIVNEGTNTHLKTTASAYGNGAFFHLEGVSNGKELVIESVNTISPYGGGVNLVASGSPDQYGSKYTDLLKSIAGTLQYNKPVVSKVSQQYMDQLKGKQLIYLHTSNGGSTRITINLNENGSYDLASNMSYMSSGGGDFSAGGRDGNKGTWKIQSRGNSTVLVLFADNGVNREYTITPGSAGGEVNLNGDRYFIKSLY